MILNRWRRASRGLDQVQCYVHLVLSLFLFVFKWIFLPWDRLDSPEWKYKPSAILKIQTKAFQNLKETIKSGCLWYSTAITWITENLHQQAFQLFILFIMSTITADWKHTWIISYLLCFVFQHVCYFKRLGEETDKTKK